MQRSHREGSQQKAVDTFQCGLQNCNALAKARSLVLKLTAHLVERLRVRGQRGRSTDVAYPHSAGLRPDYPVAGTDAVAGAHRRDLHEAEDVDLLRVPDQRDFGETGFQFFPGENGPPRL